MKVNSETQIVGCRTILVPYRISHVKKYHSWMESEELREQTASERLSLSAEYEMQQTWLRDENKCTFIVLDKDQMEKTKNEEDSMIGDVNIFLTHDEHGHLVGEISLMIAEENCRGGGRGKETALHMLRYGTEILGINKFVAVISLENEISINLFKGIKFTEESKNSMFKELTVSRPVDEEWKGWLLKNTSSYTLEPCEPNK